MKTFDLIEKKKNGGELTEGELAFFVRGVTSGEIPDYQLSAMLMAICLRGMTDGETAVLTREMANSGETMDLDSLGIGDGSCDKHSTGGVGDKTTLIVAPAAAACGVRVVKMSGRGLGATGGTADKLETIPGYNASLSLDDFQKVVKEVGVSMTVQTDEITPADKKLYALRDVTGTVASIPLITGSILSKKLAEGAGTLVFDVKCGEGAFMKTREEAVALAHSLVDGAKAAGRKTAALVTDMSAPLGRAVGNASEVAEALRWLRGEDASDPAVELCVELAALMVALTKEISLDEARQMCREKLADGSALAKFEAMVVAQGGDLDAFERRFKKPTFKFKIQAMKSGFVTAIDAEKVGKVALALGAGRMEKTDKIDPLAGITLAVRRGDRVSVGSPLATLESSREPDGLERAAADLLKAFTIGPAAPESAGLVLERID